MKQHFFLKGLITSFSLLSIIFPVYSAGESAIHDDYVFPCKQTPRHLEPYANSIFTAGFSRISAMRGDEIVNVGNNTKIVNFEVSPAGNTFAIVEESLKKGSKTASIYSTNEIQYRTHKFDINKYGTPSAITYTPNARSIVLATDRALYIFDTKKFQLEGKIEGLGINPSRMYFSPNGYYLTLVSGNDAIVLNYEARTVRKRINDDVEINDISFSPNSELMAVITADGLLSVYDTRSFEVRTMIDDLGQGLACSFNDNGKYIAVAVNSSEIELINLVRTSDRKTLELSEEGLADISFLNDSHNNTLIAYNSSNSLKAHRLLDLEPYYTRLVSETVDSRMNEWLKMLPGETMEDYEKRVNDQSLARQRRLYEDEISTQFAGDLLAMSEISLGSYDRSNNMLSVSFSNLPTILLPVAETDIAAFTSGSDLEIEEAQYGLLPDDSFELIYAKFRNKNDNKTYVYDNIDRRPMELMTSNADFVSLDILRQQQMEEIVLKEIKDKVVEEAKHNNVISDHTNIAVDSKVQPDYDADGNKILNYIVNVSYQVEPQYSAVEDFGPGKYHIQESGAASSMMKIVKQALEGEMSQYLKPGKKMKVVLSGTADATPIVRGIPYDGSYGDFDEEPILIDGVLTPISVSQKSGITTNPQLALLRAAGVRQFIEKNINIPEGMDVDYNYKVSVSKDKGSEHRRITAQFTFPDAF